jgi:hypothetical protein
MIVLAVLSSCAGNSKNDLALSKELEEGFQNSDRVISMSSAALLKSLDNKVYDPITKERASIWLPKAQQASNLTRDIYKYISELHQVKSLSPEITAELYNRLRKYKEEIFSIDSSIRMAFSESLFIINKNFDTTSNRADDFHQRFFANSYTYLINTFLRKLQNNIKIVENSVLAFCDIKTTAMVCGFDTYYPLIGQNSNYLKRGDLLEVTAGIGAFSKAAKPEIIIGGRTIEIGDDGIAKYKLKLTKMPGRHTLPFQIIYFDQTTGLTDTIKKNIEYTIVNE